MNYIVYKNIDDTITSEFKVKLYDIVTLNMAIGKINLLLFYILMRIKNKLKFVLLNVV